MGTEVCRAVLGAPDLELVAAIDPGAAGADLGELLGEGAAGLMVSSGRDAAVDGGAEVAVDFTVARSARDNLAWCADVGIHAVVGTSGLGPDDLAAVAERLAGGRCNAVVAANFALGAVLLMRFAEMAAPFMDAAEIIELHHAGKLDAPSGTALHTAERMAAARRAAGAPDLPADATTLQNLQGTRGGEGPGRVRLHAVRLPGLVAHQEVIFGAEGQSLTLRHDSYDRRSFMPGVLLAVRSVPERPGLTVGLESLLGL